MRRFLVRLLIVLILLAVSVVAFLAWLVTRDAPRWYQPPDPQDEQVALLADRVEYRLLEEAQKIRADPQPWAVRIREEQINAWLVTRLPAWLAHEHGGTWPEGLGLPQVRLLEDRAELALPIEVAGREVVAVAGLDPRVDASGVALRLSDLRLGRLVVSGDPIDKLLELTDQVVGDQGLDEETWNALINLLAGDERLPPELTLADDRTLQIVGLRVQPGAIELTSRTKPPMGADPVGAADRGADDG